MWGIIAHSATTPLILRPGQEHACACTRQTALNCRNVSGVWNEGRDHIAQDAMETAAQSGDAEIAEELLKFFVEKQEKECFAAALFTCYDLIKPDVALEVSCAWGRQTAIYCL